MLNSSIRFKANDKAVLVASDVAARGLDIPLVEHVIHYQLPRSGEIYVHRSGRTARANRDGVSLLLCSPDEVKTYNKLVQTLRKGRPYPDLPVDLSILREMKQRVNLATDIDKMEHKKEKARHEEGWMRKMAREMDLDVSDEEVDPDQGKKKNGKDETVLRNKKAELKHLLAQPMLPQGVSTRYLTGGIVADLVERLLENNDRDVLLPAHATSRAVEDIQH